MIKKILLFWGFSCLLFGQVNPSSITLTVNGPSANITVSTQVIGNLGNSNYYYWVITNFVSGQTITPFPYSQVLHAPDTLNAGNYVKVNWTSVPSAVSYDVLRTTTPVLSSPCTCALVTGLSPTINSYLDQGGSVSSYNYRPVGTANIVLQADNSGFSTARLLINAPINTTKFANLPSASTTTNQVWVIADAAASNNCTAGGGSGSTPALCYSTGSAYVSLGGGGGGSGVVVQYNSVTQGTATTLNIASCLLSVFGGGVATISPDTSCLMTIAAYQAATPTLCSTTGSSPTYSCSLSTISTTYTHGERLFVIPNFTASGVAITLNVDTLGAIPIVKADGVSNPGATDIISGQGFFVWYDGTTGTTTGNFRIASGGGASLTDSYNNLGGSVVGNNYTVVTSDLGKIITYTGTTAITVTVPTSLGAGFNFCLLQEGTGTMQFLASGTTINNPLGLTKTGGQYGMACAKEYATDTLATSGYMQ